MTAKPRARAEHARDERVEQVELELDRWRERAVPDPSAPLEADDVARLVRDCFHALHIDAGAAASFSVNTVHYYRRKDILDEPEGRTSSARYALRHVWQAAGARLAGFLGLVTLAEARDQIRGADEPTLRRFVAERVTDARARQATRDAAAPAARPLLGAASAAHAPRAAAAADRAASTAAALTATIVPLGGNAMCLIPVGHVALQSRAAARALMKSLAAALGIDL